MRYSVPHRLTSACYGGYQKWEDLCGSNVQYCCNVEQTDIFSTSNLHRDQTRCQVQCFADTIIMVHPLLQELYTYSPGQASYLNFCFMIQHTSIPANESTILLFVTHLTTSGLSYTTIKVYLSAIHSMHVVTSQHIVFNQQLTPWLQQIMTNLRHL